MDYPILGIDEAVPQDTELAVVIDVCRAFTTAAYAFRQGARRILATDTIENALALRQENAGAWVMGEQGGLPIADFDLWNSPHQLSTMDLTDRTLIQRTTAGTQGLLKCGSVPAVLAASFVVARSTVEAIRASGEQKIVFIATDRRGGERGEEDTACAAYMIDLLRGGSVLPADYLVRGRSWKIANTHVGAGGLNPTALYDFDECFRVNSLPYVMWSTRVSPHVCQLDVQRQ